MSYNATGSLLKWDLYEYRICLKLSAWEIKNTDFCSVSCVGEIVALQQVHTLFVPAGYYIESQGGHTVSAVPCCSWCFESILCQQTFINVVSNGTLCLWPRVCGLARIRAADVLPLVPEHVNVPSCMVAKCVPPVLLTSADTRTGKKWRQRTKHLLVSTMKYHLALHPHAHVFVFNPVALKDAGSTQTQGSGHQEGGGRQHEDGWWWMDIKKCVCVCAGSNPQGHWELPLHFKSSSMSGLPFLWNHPDVLLET